MNCGVMFLSVLLCTFYLAYDTLCDPTNGKYMRTKLRDVSEASILEKIVATTTTSCYIRCMNRADCYTIGLKPDSEFTETTYCFLLRKDCFNVAKQGKQISMLILVKQWGESNDEQKIHEWKEQCPASHPFAYYNGKYCCANGEEETNPTQGEVCDGSRITYTSECCQDHAYVACQASTCVTNDIVLCPVSHPYAYSSGSYCCKYNTEKIDSNVGEKCDGSQIEYTSYCCFEDDYVKCAHGNCITNDIGE